MRRDSWAQPKGWDKEETRACAAPACTSVRNLKMFPVNVPSLWDLGVWGSHCAPDQRAEPLVWVMAGLWPGWDLVPSFPWPRAPSCLLHLHSGPQDLLIMQVTPHKPAWRPRA